jgi:beta-1,4-mannosyltransferase
MQIAFFPNYARANPYLDLLERGLQEQGVVVDTTQAPRPYRGWLLQNQFRIKVLHFHWLHRIYSHLPYAKALQEVIKFAITLLYAKRLGYRIAWTMHNLYPHERPYPHLDQWVRLLILRFSDAIIVHCNQACALLRARFAYQGNVFVIPQGNYIDYYPNEISREQAREHFGFEANQVFLFQGMIRRYKGIPHLLQAFNKLPDADARLLIAGKITDSYSLNSECQNILENDRRIILHPEWISNEQLQHYYRAADFFVAPFEKVSNSASVMQALSFGCPVIVPSIGCLPELIGPDIGIRYDPQVADGLFMALEKSQKADLNSMRSSALAVVSSFTWSDNAMMTAKAYMG